MRGRLGCAALVGIAILAGCGGPSSEVSPQVDNQIRDNLSRPLTAEELKQMGAVEKNPTPTEPGSAPALPPAGKGPKGSAGQ